MRFFTEFAVLIESSFSCQNNNLFWIKTQSFANVNYHHAQMILNYRDHLSVTTNSSI